jgi:hypothetical protein
MRHALEPDHLAAVSTLAIEQRSPRRAAMLGVCWGLGHTTALLSVGFAVGTLHRKLPIALANAFELVVAAMLIVLGIRAVVRSTDLRGNVSKHEHRGHSHSHAGPAAHVHVGRRTFAARSLVIGLVHGLAGSGALTTLVIAKLPSTGARLAYVALFGFGSLLGMALLTGLMGWPLARVGRDQRIARAVGLATGTFSTVLGVAWGWPLVTALVG